MRNQSVTNSPVLVASTDLTAREARLIANFRQLCEEAQNTYCACFESNLQIPKLRRVSSQIAAKPVSGTNVFALRGGSL